MTLKIGLSGRLMVSIILLSSRMMQLAGVLRPPTDACLFHYRKFNRKLELTKKKNLKGIDMFSSKKQIIRECPKCSSSNYWDGTRCVWCGYIHKLAAKDENTSKLIQDLFKPCLYDPHDIFIGTQRVPQSPGLYGWFFDKSLVNILPNIESNSFFIEPDGISEPERDWFLLYVGIAGKKKGRTLQDRIHGDHLNKNSKGSTLRQSLAALLWKKINLVPKLHLNGQDEKAKLNLWMFENARVTWLDTPKPQKIEKILLKEFGEYLPLNLQENKANPYRKEIKRLRKSWRNGG